MIDRALRETVRVVLHLVQTARTEDAVVADTGARRGGPESLLLLRQESRMDATDPRTMYLILGAIIVALIAVGAWIYAQRARSRRLEQRFGPEYKRAVDEMGSRTKGEAELASREKRVQKLDIVPLPPAEAARFDQSWKALQARFVDNPKGVLADADRLVRELMQARGYPMADFDRLAADISVHHPTVVDHYRAAQAIAQRDRQGQADTEELRKAVVHYRALFQELLEVEQAPRVQRETSEMRT
jgi:hypothetical protein